MDTPATNTSAYEELSPKRRRFVDEYFACNMVAWRGYVAAGYGSAEPSRRDDPEAWEKWYRSARANSARMIADDNVKAAIAERTAARAMKADEVLARLSEHASASLAPFVRITPEGRVEFDFSHPEAAEHLHLIKKIKTRRETGTDGEGGDWEKEWVEVEMYDALAAKRELVRIYGMATDRVDVTSGGQPVKGVEITIRPSRERHAD